MAYFKSKPITKPDIRTKLKQMANEDIGFDNSYLQAAIMLSALDRPFVAMDQIEEKLEKYSTTLEGAFYSIGSIENGDLTAPQIVDIFREVFHHQLGFDGNHRDFDALENTDILCVLEKQMGLPITLCILAKDLLDKAGVEADILNFPGYVYLRITAGGRQVIIDVFDGCSVVEAQHLRAAIKKYLGPEAELASSYTEAMNGQQMLIRLQNNRKMRLIAREEYMKALSIIEMMRVIDPQEKRLYFEESLLFSRIGHAKKALAKIEGYMEFPLTMDERLEADSLVQELMQDL